MAYLYQKKGVFYIGYSLNNESFQKSLHTKNKDEAEEERVYFRKIELKNLRQDDSIVPKNIKKIIEEYLSSEDLKSRGLKSKRNTFCEIDIVRKFFACKGISESSQIKKSVLSDYQRYLQSEYVSSKKDRIEEPTVNRKTDQLVRLLKFIRKNGYLAHSIAYYKETYERLSEPVKEKQILSKEQVNTILKTANEKAAWLEVGVGIAYYTGFRIEEILFLEWSNYDAKKKKLKITAKPGFQIKTKKERTVPVANSLVKILARAKRYKNKCTLVFYSCPHCYYAFKSSEKEFEKIKAMESCKRCDKRVRKWGEKKYSFDFIFRTRSGTAFHINYDRELRNLLKLSKVVLQKGILWHIFRHTFATHMMDRGVDVRKVAKMMGDNPFTVRERYDQINVAGDHDSVNLLD